MTLLKTARFANVLLVALTLGLVFCHAMEIPGKLRLTGAEWLTVQQNLYVAFGVVGAAVEVLAVLTTWIVLALVRRRRPARSWTLAAAVSVTAALVLWFLVVAPVNAALSGWTPETLPADWTHHRDRWEIGHAICALLFGFGLSALVIALLAEAPDEAETPDEAIRRRR